MGRNERVSKVDQRLILNEHGFLLEEEVQFHGIACGIIHDLFIEQDRPADRLSVSVQQ